MTTVKPQGETLRELESEKYKAAAALHRFETTLMYGELTVYLICLSSLMKVVFEKQELDQPCRLALGVACLVLTITFGYFTWRAGRHSIHAREQAADLEKDTGLKLYSRRNLRNTILNATNATLLVYALGIVGALCIFSGYLP